jgi:apolipoprotein N-acyltransferase
MNYLLVFFAGALSVLAYSPFNLWWLSIASLTLLLSIVYQRPELSGFKLGYCFGLGMFGFGVSWVFNSLHEFGQAPVIFALLLTILFVLYLSIFPALTMWWFSRCNRTRQHAASRILLFVSTWVLTEWLRGWLMTGFPWLSLGHAMIDSPYAGIIPIFGTFGASALVALIAISLLELLNASSRQKYIWLTISLLVSVGIYSIQSIEWTNKTREQSMKVALVQANIPFELKWDKSKRNQLYQRYVDLTEKNWHSDIIVWPETAIPTFYIQAKQDFLPAIEQQALEHNAEIISGVFTYDGATERIYNSLVTIGGEAQVYSKKHLVPFGEFLPFRNIIDLFAAFITLPMADISAGAGDSIMVVKSVPVGVSICYEAVYGNEILSALPEAQILVNVTNDAWFGDSLAPQQHLQITRSRALETGRYMLRAANTGISAIITPKGESLQQSAQFIETSVTGEIWPMHGTTPFMRWGNWGIIGIMMIFFVVGSRASQFKQKI